MKRALDNGGSPAVWRLDLAYDGSAFRGWARQPGQRTVEGVLEAALATILREPVRLSVAGRTDAGVHALAQVASFAVRRGDLRPERLLLSLNAVLPADVAVQAVRPAASGFVARVARSRTYRYRLWVAPARPVFERGQVWPLRGKLDDALLAEAARSLVGEHDFSALTPSAHLYHSCVRAVSAAAWHRAPGGQEWLFEITAGSFLHNMVRVAVGSMVDVAQGRMTLQSFAEGLAGGERRSMGQTAPPCGLALVAVAY